MIGISKKDLADEAFYEQGAKVKTEERFREVVTRLNDLRNPVVHQASLDVYTLKPILIEEEEIDQLMKDLDKIVHAMIVVIRNKMVEEQA